MDIRQDGSFTAPGFAGAWQRSGESGHYALTWPAAVDRVTLSSDGLRLHGGNQYGVKLTAQRVSGNPAELAGTWLWWNGATVLINPGGSIVAGPFQGRWAGVGGADYTFTWPEPIDQVTMSSDGSRLTGRNQYGFTLTAQRLRN